MAGQYISFLLSCNNSVLTVSILPDYLPQYKYFLLYQHFYYLFPQISMFYFQSPAVLFFLHFVFLTSLTHIFQLLLLQNLPVLPSMPLYPAVHPLQQMEIIAPVPLNCHLPHYLYLFLFYYFPFFLQNFNIYPVLKLIP